MSPTSVAFAERSVLPASRGTMHGAPLDTTTLTGAIEPRVVPTSG